MEYAPSASDDDGADQAPRASAVVVAISTPGMVLLLYTVTVDNAWAVPDIVGV